MATLESARSGINRQLFDALPLPANHDYPTPTPFSEPKIISWLLRMGGKAVTTRNHALKVVIEPHQPAEDDWQMVTSLCGHSSGDFAAANVELPLTAAEIDYFRRNHRETDMLVGRDFLAAKSDLPTPLCELYGLYRHRARLDAEAALFIAQATGSTRVARIMADLLAIGGFANGHESIAHMTATYAIAAAFDTAALIDRANHEAARRLQLSIDHPAHLLKLSPDEISVLAVNLVEKNVLSAPDFLKKANLLAEARQDVNRLPAHLHLATAIGERDLPIDQEWVVRICAGYARIFESWVASLPEIDAVLNPVAGQTKKDSPH